MPTLLTLAMLAAAPDAGVAEGLPPPREMVTLYFLAGDLKRASDFAQLCVRKEGKKCRPLLVDVAEYQSMIIRRDEFTRDDAKKFLGLDRKLSPGKLGKATEPVHRRFVVETFANAERLESAGEPSTAQEVAEKVLELDPAYQPAKDLVAKLKLPVHETKGGAPGKRDAGR